MMRKKTRGAKRFEQQAYPPKKKSLFSFLFYFHCLLSIIKKCDLAGLTNMMHLVLWLWVSLHDFDENHLYLLISWFWVTLRVWRGLVKTCACGCTHVCMLKLLLLFLPRLMTMAWCMTTLRKQRTKPGEILCLRVYIYWVLPLLTYN